jgi:hypothetical protein
VADETVRGEPVCEGKSLLTGKFTGNFTKIGAVWQKIARENAAKSVSCRTIPYKMKQGINLHRTGNLLNRAGNLQRPAGNCPAIFFADPLFNRGERIDPNADVVLPAAIGTDGGLKIPSSLGP